MLVPDSKTIRRKASHKWISSPEEGPLTVFEVMSSQKSGGAILLCTSLCSNPNLILGISAPGCIDIRMMGRGREGKEHSVCFCEIACDLHRRKEVT